MIRLDEYAACAPLPDPVFGALTQLRAASRDDHIRAFLCKQQRGRFPDVAPVTIATLPDNFPAM
jgi:hypothetical protein